MLPLLADHHAAAEDVLPPAVWDYYQAGSGAEVTVGEAERSWHAYRLRPRVLRTVDVSPAVLLGGSIPWLQRHGVWRRAVENSFELDQLIHAEIRERRAAPDL